MIDIVINQFVFPNYVGMKYKPNYKIKNTSKFVVVILNGEELKYNSRYDAAKALGISTSVIHGCLARNKSVKRKNGDIVYFKEIKKDEC